MKKQISAVIVMLVLCFSVCVPVFAAKDEYIIDKSGELTSNKLETLNERAEAFADSTGYDILYANINDEDDEEFANQMTLGKNKNKILLVENDKYSAIYTYGEADIYISEQDANSLIDVFDDGDESNSPETLYSSVVAYMSAAENMVKEKTTSTLTSGTTSESNNSVQTIGGYKVTNGTNNTLILENRTRMVDMAELLDDSEKSALLSKLDEISERQQLDVVVVTVNGLDGKTPEAYADDFYDYNNYGFGTGKDGVLLLISMEERDWHITTTGFGITAFTDKGIKYIEKQFKPDLSDGDYYEAFEEFANQCDSFITQAKTGKPYDSGNMPKSPFPVGSAIVMGLIIGLVVAFVATSIMRGKLKSVRMQPSASDYLKQNSLKVTQRQDVFLYSNVSKIRRETNSSSHGGGSSTHRSSSGSSHGGGGGKF